MVQLGFSGSYTFSVFGYGISGTYFVGAALDGHGNIATYYGGGGGAGTGFGASGGVQTLTSNAGTICDLAGGACHSSYRRAKKSLS